ncbi:UDP-glucuronosyl/UDP-glucosyltransferase [Trema orientale]|uniref:Glycosyltransferase n=1 Tax=Trema orientale TaxID=63057 RepID=A0A2P5DAD1_TREOI|nr:UDP-glucuronosyl/UDP-glucosyltransferase [Trema orientale]
MAESTGHIVILPSPGISHLIPFAELAKRLVLHHNFNVTFLILTTNGDLSGATKALLESLPAAVDSIFLPPVNFDDLPKYTKPSLKLSLSVTRSLPSLRHVLNSLLATNSNRLVAFLADAFGFEALEVAKGLNIPPYLFFPSNATSLSLFFHLPKLDETVSVRFMRDLPDPVKLPGCVPLHGKDLFDPIQDRKSEAYESFLNLSKRVALADGIIVNSFLELEPEALKALQEDGGADGTRRPLIYPVGPIVQTRSSSSNDGSECLSWLDIQPRGSVLYVSFGSGGTLSSDQLTELAFGLEMSGQKFLWVVKRPSNESANAAYLSEGQSQFEPSDFLPNGFLERTRDRGLVVTYWAPQTQILSHGSTGGFISHCGWSSTLESVVNGVPLIAWPLFAEQKLNAVLLEEGLKVALRPKAEENGVVRREEIAKVVKVLMDKGSEEGKKVRDRMEELKQAAAKAIDRDGSSIKALSDLAFTLKNKAAN